MDMRARRYYVMDYIRTAYVLHTYYIRTTYVLHTYYIRTTYMGQSTRSILNSVEHTYELLSAALLFLARHSCAA